MNKKYKETDLEQCKIVLKNLLDAVPIESKIFGICCHPFTDTAIIPDLTNKDMGNYWNLTIDDDFEKWRNYIFNKIDAKDNIYSLFIMINKPYKLAALKYCKDYLSIYDFSKLLKNCWTISENPNKDINVSCNELIRFFKRADKKVLMDDNEYQIWINLPDEITLYRGVASKSNPKGLSWTKNLEIAKWFKDRWKADGYILEATVKKEDVFCYFTNRDEDEFIVNVNNIQIQKY